MEGELRAVVDLLERLDRLAVRIFRVCRAQRPLIDHASEKAQAIVNEELKDGPVHV